MTLKFVSKSVSVDLLVSTTLQTQHQAPCSSALLWQPCWLLWGCLDSLPPCSTARPMPLRALWTWKARQHHAWLMNDPGCAFPRRGEGGKEAAECLIGADWPPWRMGVSSKCFRYHNTVISLLPQLDGVVIELVFGAIGSLICWRTQACLSPWASGAANALEFDLTPSSRLSLRFSSWTFVLWNQWLQLPRSFLKMTPGESGLQLLVPK